MKQKDGSILKKFGAHLLAIRHARGLSQEDVSFRCDVDRAKISKLETGTANCYLTTVVELAKGLGVEAKELLDF